MTTAAADHVTTVRNYLAAVERLQDVDEVVSFWHPEGIFEELPNAISPRGSTRDRSTLVKSFGHAKTLIATQRNEVVNIFGAGDQVLVEFVWTGTLAIDAGPLRAGETLRARCAGVFTMRDGLIYRQRQYDCYDPR
ncbi:MAG: nuclear transport factor 2 family protein [Minicystis sp.]